MTACGLQYYSSEELELLLNQILNQVLGRTRFLFPSLAFIYPFKTSLKTFFMRPVELVVNSFFYHTLDSIYLLLWFELSVHLFLGMLVRSSSLRSLQAGKCAM